MNRSICLGRELHKTWLRAIPAFQLQAQTRTVATHAYSHHASALSKLPSNVDKSSEEYRENARQMGEVMARMQELHHKIEAGGSAKARDKHVARGKMLPREYVAGMTSSSESASTDTIPIQPRHRSYRCWKCVPRTFIPRWTRPVSWGGCASWWYNYRCGNCARNPMYDSSQ